jgi:protein phosphatase
MRAVRVTWAAKTDVGRKRDHNEDSHLVNPDLNVFVVADGMGGHAGGETASRLAVETIDREMKAFHARPDNPWAAQVEIPDSPLADALRDAVEGACSAVWKTAQANPNLDGMGTTVTALLVNGDHVFVGHVGDSRCYIVRGPDVLQVTEDHSLVNEQLKMGLITPDEARHSRLKNIITRSVGFEEDVLVDAMGLRGEPGDTFVMCSDGLSNLVEDQEIARVVREEPLDHAPDKLIDMANERGGDDNITVLVIRLEA